MASEIRVNKINSRTGVGTITLSPTGVDFTGIATVATLKATTGIVTTFSATSNATVGGTLGVTGTSTLSGNATVGGTLNVTGETTFATHVNLGDSDKLKFGASGDLEIYHDGSNSYVNDAGTGGLFIRAANQIGFRDAANSFANFANFVSGGAIDLYYNGSKKFETTASGVNVTGAFNVGSATSITSSSLKVNDVQYPTSGPLSNRNLMINGAMQVAQRGTTSTVNGYGTVDRIKVEYGQAQITQYQLSLTSGAPFNEGFRYALRQKVTTASSSGNSYAQFRTHLEGQNIAQSGWNYGDSNATLVTSFWARSSLAGTYYVQYRFPDSGSNNYFNRAFTLSADTWTKITNTVPGRSGLVIDNNNGNGLEYVICPYYGTDYTGSNATTDSYFSLAGNDYFPNFAQDFPSTLNATFDVTGIQLEVGSKATPFEHRTYGDDVRICQRYYTQSYNTYETPGADTTSSNPGVISSTAYGTISYASPGTAFFPVEMRGTPTVTIYSYDGTLGKINADNTEGTGSAFRISTKSAFFARSNDSAGVGANVYVSCHYTAEAEL